MEIAVAKPFIILSAYLMTAATVSPPTACCKEREREETWKKGSVKLIKFFEDNEDTRSMTQMQVHTYCTALHLAARTHAHTHARTHARTHAHTHTHTHIHSVHGRTSTCGIFWYLHAISISSFAWPSPPPSLPLPSPLTGCGA